MLTLQTNQDKSQSFWQLAFIQSSAQGLPVILVGGKIAQTYGAGAAILAILIGNLVLWVIGIAIILMAFRGRKNAIQNIEEYVGFWPSILACLVLTAAFLSWFMLQNKNFAAALGPLPHLKGTPQIEYTTMLSFGISFLAYWGIRLIKKVSCLFPFLLGYVVYSMITYSSPISLVGTWAISFPAIVAIIALTLPGIMNLPTFFRHARSVSDGILALTLMTIFVSLFQIFSVVMVITDPSDFFAKVLPMNPGFFSYLLPMGFIVISLISVNLVNIYFASAGWETIGNILLRKSHSPRWSSGWRLLLSRCLLPRPGSDHVKFLGRVCLVIGIIGTVFDLLLRSNIFVQMLENVADDSLSSLGLLLPLAFLTKLIVRHRPRILEKEINFICWACGTITSVIIQCFFNVNSYRALTAGMGTSLLIFVLIIFYEETKWSVMDLIKKS
ncbi:MAG: hypothetical protein NTX49_02220 [Chlamydiae bacterium]|nr:hypothetical protein [Chlamydiota bacterium]